MTPGKDMIQLELARDKYYKSSFCFVGHLCINLGPGRPNVLISDISDGKEWVRIPVINDTGISVDPPEFHYILHFDFISDEAEQCIEEAKRAGVCTGCQLANNNRNYGPSGLLLKLQPEGIRECPSSCTTCNNHVVETGIRYPLEVFRTENKGWGVRCYVDLPAGAFVCEYVGEILTDREAVRLGFSKNC